MNHRNKEWTPEECQIVTELIKQKRTIKEIYHIFNYRSYQSVYHKIHSMFKNQIENNVYWKPEEISQLKLLQTLKHTDKEIGQKLGKTTMAIKRKRQRLKMPSNSRWGNLVNDIHNKNDKKEFFNKYGVNPLTYKINLCYKSTKCMAWQRELDMSLSRHDIIETYYKQNGKCFYSGIEMELESGSILFRNPKILSIDRIDSSKGYIKENIVLCCGTINIMKNNLTVQEFLDFCQKITKHNS